METNQADRVVSPFVYTLPGKNGPANRFQLALQVVLLVAAGAGLITIIFWLQDKITSNKYFLYVMVFLAEVYVIIALGIILKRWWTWKNQTYTVSLGNYGVSVKGSHPLCGKYIRWQEIDKIKLASYSADLEISTFGDLARLKIPCGLERFAQLISLLAQYIEVNQPNREYPKLYQPRYRYVKLLMVFSLAGISSILAYITQNIAFLLLYIFVGAYLLLDTSLFQKITLADDGLIVQKLWLSKCYPFPTIKHLLLNHEQREYSTIYFLGIVTTEKPKPCYVRLRGFDPINLYLAVHQAWQKAKTNRTQSNIIR